MTMQDVLDFLFWILDALAIGIGGLALLAMVAHWVSREYRNVCREISGNCDISRKAAFLLVKAIRPNYKTRFIKYGSPELAARIMFLSGLSTEQSPKHMAKLACHLESVGIGWRCASEGERSRMYGYFTDLTTSEMNQRYTNLMFNSQFLLCMDEFRGHRIIM